MKLPNGYGSITKAKDNRRRPWRVRVTVGFTDDGKQKFKNIGYYGSRKDALAALNEYHANPYIINNNITFKEVFERYSESKFKDISETSIKAYLLAFKYFKNLHELEFAKIKTDALKKEIDSISKHGIKRKMKTLLNQMYAYAMENDIVDKNYSNYVKVGRNTDKAIKQPFTAEEIATLFNNIDNFEIVDTVLIMIYSGLRIGELLDLKKENINIEEHYIVGGNKTDAGKDRLIPMNNKIWKLVLKRYLASEDYLILNANTNSKMTYRVYRDRFDKLMKNLNMDHTPHECRHTFATLMDNAGANERSITRLIGHNSFLTTEKYYTHKDIDELKKAIDLI